MSMLAGAASCPWSIWSGTAVGGAAIRSRIALAIALVYPVITRAPTPSAAARLNDVVRDYLVTGWGESKPTSIEQAADTVMRELEFEKRDDRSLAWWLDVTVAILYEFPAIVSIKFDSRPFQGGVHPNRNASFASFTTNTGMRITLDDVLVAGYRARLTRIAETAFLSTDHMCGWSIPGRIVVRYGGDPDVELGLILCRKASLAPRALLA